MRRQPAENDLVAVCGETIDCRIPRLTVLRGHRQVCPSVGSGFWDFVFRVLKELPVVVPKRTDEIRVRTYVVRTYCTRVRTRALCDVGDHWSSL